MEKDKKRIDLFIDFNKLEKILDSIATDFEKSQSSASPEATFGFSISIGDGKIDFERTTGQEETQTRIETSGNAAEENQSPKEPAAENIPTGDSFKLVFDLPGITSMSQVRVRHSGGALLLSASSSSASYSCRKKIPAGHAVRKKHFNNGILEVAFRKAGRKAGKRKANKSQGASN